MLRGISTCLCEITVHTKHKFPGPPRSPPIVYSALSKGFSSAGIEDGETSEKVVERMIDQSFTASHDASDGRRFQFATVMVRAMRRGESPLRIWEQACALIGGNFPTLAVAFISKPTESALRTVKVLAGQISAGGKNESKQSLPSPSPTYCSEILPAAASSELDRPSMLETDATSPQRNSLNVSSDAADGRQTSCGSPGVLHEAEHIPLIGCILKDLGGEFESSGDVGSGTSEVNQQGSSSSDLHFVLQVDGGRHWGFSDHRDGLEEHQVDRRLRVDGFRPGSSVSLLDSNDVQEEDGEEGTVSDWEYVCSEYGGEEALKALDAKADSEDEEGDCKNGSAHQISKEGLFSFLNALVRCRKPAEASRGLGGVTALESREKIAGTQKREMESDMGSHRETTARSATRDGHAAEDGLHSELERCLESTEPGIPPRHSARQEGLGSDSLFGDYEGTITVEPKSGSGEAGVSGSDYRQEDVNYSLVLCVGHMPGAKAVAFHSSTTGLPRLPDLQNAVTENNPHMLLLGAPGFVFPEFIQRLATVFPASCRLQSGCIPAAIVH